MFEKNSNLISNLIFYFRILFLVRVLSISCVLSFAYSFVVHTIAVTKMEIDEPAKTSHKGEKIRSYTISFRSSHQRCSMKKGVLRNFTISQILQKRLWHRCFPVNFVKFLRTAFLQNTSGRLLL